MWTELLSALALVFILEGIIPFLSPRSLKEILVTILGMDERALRVAGLLSMITGLTLLYVVRFV